MPLCCWDDCNADSADGARLFKIYIRFSAPARGFIHSWLWVRNDHLLKQTITVERSVMAEIMSSCGEGARALHEDALAWYVWAMSCPKWKIWSHRALPQKLGPVSFSDIVACYSLCLETLGCCTLELCCDITGLVLCCCGCCVLLWWDNISALFFHFSNFNSLCTLLSPSLKCCRPSHFPFGFGEPPVRQRPCLSAGLLQHSWSSVALPFSSLFLSK